MTLDPAAERARIHVRYAPFGRRDAVSWALLLGAAALANLFLRVDWWAFAGFALWAVIWEITKWKLRRNADRFSAESR